MEAKASTDCVAAYLAAERQHITSLRPEDDVLAVDSSFYAAGLVLTFEVATQLVATLYQLHRFRIRVPIGISGINGPVSLHVGRWALARLRLCRGDTRDCREHD